MQGAVSWIAVKGAGAASALETLGFVKARDGEKNPKASFTTLANGWTIICTLDFGFPTPERMKALSQGGLAVACSSDDRSMGSVARGYQDGSALWSIEHDGGAQGVYHLSVAGDPPAAWAEIRDAAIREQDGEGGTGSDVDCLFDAPIALAGALCGYRHDRDWPTAETQSFTLLTTKLRTGGVLGLFKAR